MDKKAPFLPLFDVQASHHNIICLSALSQHRRLGGVVCRNYTLPIVVWSIICAFGAQELRAHAAADPGGLAETWLYDIESCKNAVSLIGTLFVFTLVFRFNACYDRWWESRIFWVSYSCTSRSIESKFSLLLFLTTSICFVHRVTSYPSV